jgi:hypothetical protein
MQGETTYRPRFADAELRACPGAAGAVVIEGPKACGKTRQGPAVAALGGSPDRLLKDLESLGLLFESLVIRDLRVLAQALDGDGYHHGDD